MPPIGGSGERRRVPKPRGDYQCLACGEMYELPLGAIQCPDTECNGILERRFTTAPAVLRGADQQTEPIRAAMLENAAADEANAQRARRNYDPRFTSVGNLGGPISQTTQSREGMKIGIPALAQAIPAESKLASQSINMPILHSIGRLKGPKPGPGSKFD